MEIHKPRPWHGWRELLKEYFIIVLGVATALAAEQAVEALHNRNRAAEARASIHGEIADNLTRMNLRQAVEPCMAKRLDEIDDLIADYARGLVPQQTVWIGVPFAYLMHDSKYKAAIQSGAVSLFDDNEQAAYADLYAIFENYWRDAQEETRAWNDLRTLEKRPPYTATLDWQLRSAMQQARTTRSFIILGHQVVTGEAREIDIGPATLTATLTGNEFATRTVCLPLNTSRAEVEKQYVANGLTLP